MLDPGLSVAIASSSRWAWGGTRIRLEPTGDSGTGGSAAPLLTGGRDNLEAGEEDPTDGDEATPAVLTEAGRVAGKLWRFASVEVERLPTVDKGLDDRPGVSV